VRKEESALGHKWLQTEKSDFSEYGLSGFFRESRAHFLTSLVVLIKKRKK
jgi:hypothetical protein